MGQDLPEIEAQCWAIYDKLTAAERERFFEWTLAEFTPGQLVFAAQALLTIEGDRGSGSEVTSRQV